MSRGTAMQLALLGAFGCASGQTPAAPKLKASSPASSASSAQRASSAAPCRGERVLSLEPARGNAPPGVVALFAPWLLTQDAADAGGAYERIATTVLGSVPPSSVSEAVDICRDWPRANMTRNGRGDRVRIFDVQRFTTTGSPAALTLALSSTDALEALLSGGTANWLVTLLDSEYQVVARSSFVTERPAEMTLDGVGAVLRLEHGVVHARVAFGCADKNGERFDVPIELAPSCLSAQSAASPPAAYPSPLAHGPCDAQRVSAAAPRALPSYEDTQGQTHPWLAMPYVADDVAALDTDWWRIAQLLSPRGGEPVRPEPSETLQASVAIGSPRHATVRWSYVKSPALRLYQLLPLRDDRGREAYLALYSHDPPYEIVRSKRSEWHVALLSPSYAVLSDVAFTTAPPAERYVALQTELDLQDGSPIAAVQYLKELPESANAGTHSDTSRTASFRRSLHVDIARGCAELEAP